MTFALILLFVALGDPCVAASPKDPADAPVSVGERVTIPGSAVSFLATIPLEPSNGFQGFEHVSADIAIIGTELPTPPGTVTTALDSLDRQLTPAGLAKQGMRAVEKHRQEIGGVQALVVRGEMSRDKSDYAKWIIFLPKSRVVAQIQLIFPKEIDDANRKSLESLLESIRWEEVAAPPRLPYTLELPSGWKLAKQAAVVDLYSLNGAFPPEPGKSLMYLVMHERVPLSKRSAWVTRKNLQRNHYSNLKEVESVDEKIDGFDATFSKVEGTSTQKQRPVILLYCYIFLPDTAVLIESEEIAGMTFPQFQSIVRTWKLKRR